jgi:hypothetical protein
MEHRVGDIGGFPKSSAMRTSSSPASSTPTLAQNARMGHPLSGMSRGDQDQSLGHPPDTSQGEQMTFGEALQHVMGAIGASWEDLGLSPFASPGPKSDVLPPAENPTYTPEGSPQNE